ncbi:MAG: ArsR/SmtB family transcription factor [Candidatus Binatia bacterium]
MVIYKTQQLDGIFGALANRTRREILDLLTKSERTVMELAGRFDMSQPAITKHLKVLERAGLIQKRVEGRYRYCTLDTKKLEDASEWIERTRRYWEETFAALDEYIGQSKEKEDGS